MYSSLILTSVQTALINEAAFIFGLIGVVYALILYLANIGYSYGCMCFVRIRVFL